MPGSGRRGRLLAVRRALRRPLDQARVLQDALGPAVAQLELVLGPQPLVEVLDGEVEIARPVLLQQPFDPIDRHPPARHPAAPPIDQAFRPLRLVAIPEPPKVPLAHPQHLGCLATAQRPTPPPTDRLDDPSHPNLRLHTTSPILPNRTDRELRNPDIPRATNTQAGKTLTSSRWNPSSTGGRFAAIAALVGGAWSWPYRCLTRSIEPSRGVWPRRLRSRFFWQSLRSSRRSSSMGSPRSPGDPRVVPQQGDLVESHLGGPPCPAWKPGRAGKLVVVRGQTRPDAGQPVGPTARGRRSADHAPRQSTRRPAPSGQASN